MSLGCPKNLVDSERMVGLLAADGYRRVDQPDGADFVIINTCGFLQAARDESTDAIREALRLKKRGKTGGVLVTGCLAQRDQDSLLAQCPGIDQLVGVFAREEIVGAADRILGQMEEQRTVFRPAPSTPLSDRNRLRLTPTHLAYLKISEGCNRRCTFCSIPGIRGAYASKPVDEVLAEAEQLIAQGARELNLIAQDTTFYGIDLYGQPRLADLLRRLDTLPGLEWIRVLYLYPMHFTEDLFDALSHCGKVLPYLDLPLQHINDKVLRQMNRQVDRRTTESLLDRLRSEIPALVLRTTMITGFPGETEAEFEELASFVEQRRFERLGVFPYSLEPDTASARLPGHVPEQVRQDRRNRLMEIQQKIAFDWNASQVGRILDILIDSDIPGENDAFVGRSYADAPEIDGVVYVSGARLRPGQIVACEIVAWQGYDLIAAAVGPPR